MHLFKIQGLLKSFKEEPSSTNILIKDLNITGSPFGQFKFLDYPSEPLKGRQSLFHINKAQEYLFNPFSSLLDKSVPDIGIGDKGS